MLRRCLQSALLSLAVNAAHAENVEQFGPLKLGRALPKEAKFDTAPKGRFYVYFIDRSLPLGCLDEECGAEGRDIVEMGGHLIGGSDVSLAALFGVRTSLAVLSDSKGLVMQIVPEAAPSDLGPLAQTGANLAKLLEAAEKKEEDCGGCKIPPWAKAR